MESARRLVGVKPGVNEIASVEGSSEALRSRAVLGWQVWLRWHLRSVSLVRGLVQQVLLQGLLRVLNLISDSWERSRMKICFLDLSHIFLDSLIHLIVKFFIFSHLLKGFMLVGPH